MSDLYWLTEEQMARLSPYFPKSHGKPRVDDRRVLSGSSSSTGTACAGGMRQGSMGHTRHCITAGNGGA
jgi:transposase